MAPVPGDGSRSPASVSALQALVAAKDAALAEWMETASAFKLLNEKQTAEINAKELLLARKTERIEELLQQLQAQEQLVGERDSALALLQSKLHAASSEIEELRAQVEKEDDEFAMLSAALVSRDHQLLVKTDEVANLAESEHQLRKDVDKLQVQLRRWETHSSSTSSATATTSRLKMTTTETADACLSPRSFHEHQLIALRDDALAAKTQEIWLLAGQNAQLRGHLDELESELERLQSALVARENDVARRERRIDKLQNQVVALEGARQQADGRERAIEVASVQNAKLLQALQLEEAQTETLRRALVESERECEALRQTQRFTRVQAAASEVDTLQHRKQTELQATALHALQEKLHRERQTLHAELARARLEAQMEVEKLQSELVMRRGKQYELTLALHEAQAAVHATKDERESLKEELGATRLRMEEAERVLGDALRWKAALEDELTNVRAVAERTAAEGKSMVQKSEKEVAALRAQVQELKDAVVARLDHEKKLGFRISELTRGIEKTEATVSEHKERITRLVAEAAAAAQAREESERERRIVQSQLEKLSNQMQTRVAEAMEKEDAAVAKWKRAIATCKEVEKEWGREQRGKNKVVAMVGQALVGKNWAAVAMLDLRDCWLADADAAVVFAAVTASVSLRGTLTHVDLRGNRLTKEVMKSLVQWLRRACVGDGAALREVDLRANYVTLDGVREVATALEAMAESEGGCGFSKVMVSGGGVRVECFTGSTAELPRLTVDVTENGSPDELLRGVAVGASSKRVRRKEEVGGEQMDPVLQEVYGVDLVAKFMGEVVTGRARRKSGERSGFLASSSTLVELSGMNTSSNNQLSGESPRLATITSPRGFNASVSTPTRSLSSSASLPRL